MDTNATDRMTDSVPENETATTPPAADSSQNGTKHRVKWTREHRLAFGANIASFASAGFAAAAFLILLWTLWTTQDSLTASRNAVAEAHEQAVQARQQTAIAQDSLIASSRPWIMLTDIKPAILTSDDEAGVGLWVNISVKNVGHSPAQNVSLSGRLLIKDYDPPQSEAMANVCQGPRKGSYIIPGQVLFPDQTQDIDAGVGTGFDIGADKVWAARAARIKSVYEAKVADGKPERAQAFANALAKFPFYAPLSFVGCINYHSADNAYLYQTSFMFDISEKITRNSFPLLSGQPPTIRYPEPVPGDPDTLKVFAREMQRSIPGERIRLGTPLYGTFAN